MHFFSSDFSDCAVSHIPHAYSKEMAKKSEIVSSINNWYIYVAVLSMFIILQVPLGVLAKNENEYEDMISIMEHNHQYVPILPPTLWK